jgi:hypothetical protein
MAGRMRFERVGAGVEWTTMLRFHGVPGRAVWSLVGPVHRAVAPRCLERARETLVRRAAVLVPAG